MSSNPFRSRMPVEPDPSSANIFDTPAFAPASEDAALTTPPIRTKKKKVVIQTPPHSPELIHSRENGGRTLSASLSTARAPSPPSPQRDRSTNVTDASVSESISTADDSGVERAAADTGRRILGPVAGVEPASEGAMRPAYNPFSKTLSASEAGLGYQKAEADRDGAEREHKEQRKPVMDVDMFKNILMTGGPVPVPAAAGLSTTGGQTRQHDRGTHTTRSSSAFDPAYGLHPESPIIGYDEYQSASDDESERDHEHSQLMGAGRSDDLAPPAPPKPKRGPQTVSFADFDQSIPPGFQSAGPPANTQHVTGILRTSTPPRSNSDLNKPLPPPPQASLTDIDPPTVPAKDMSSHQTIMSAAPLGEDETTLKKAPPPPPSSRRQLAGHGRPRSVSNVSNLTQDSAATVPGSETSSPQQKPDQSNHKPAPPPPPHRRSMPGAQPTTYTPPRDVSPQPSDSKHAPAPPPRRHGSKPSGSGHTSRKTSDDSTTANRVDPSSPSAGGSAPPPPPPRRERGSKRTSLDGPLASLPRRLSGEHYRGTSFDSERSASISSLQKVAETNESSEQAVASPDSSRDILADMAAFQAEIDALRAGGTKAR